MATQEVAVFPCDPLNTINGEICRHCYKNLNINIPSIICHAQTEEGRNFASTHPQLIDLLIRPTTSTQFLRANLPYPPNTADIDYINYNVEILCFCGEVWKGKRNLWIHLTACPIIHMVNLSPELDRVFRTMADAIHTGELAMIRELEEDTSEGSSEEGDDDDDDDDAAGDGGADGDADEVMSDPDWEPTSSTSRGSAHGAGRRHVRRSQRVRRARNNAPLVPAPGTLPNNPHGIAVPGFLDRLTTDRRVTKKPWARTAVRVFNTGNLASRRCENCARTGKTCIVSRHYVRCAGCTKLDTWCRGVVPGETRPPPPPRPRRDREDGEGGEGTAGGGEAEAEREEEERGEEEREEEEERSQIESPEWDSLFDGDDPRNDDPGGGGAGGEGHGEAQMVMA